MADARTGLLCALLVAAAAACAPGLEYPGRFDYLAGDGGGPDAGPDAGEDAGPDAGDAGDAGSPDAGDGGSDAGSDGGPDAGVDAGCDAVAQILVPTCSTSACHSRDLAQSGLDLESPDVLTRLIEIPSQEDPQGLLRLIDANNPDKSFLYTKVLANPPFGSRMPNGLNALSDADTACLRSWIHRSVGK